MAGNHSHCSNNGDADPFKMSAAIKPRRKSAVISRVSDDVDDIINLLHGSDPVKIELNRLENDVRDKERELGDAHAEIKALKYSERLKEKAVEELTDELKKMDKKLKAAELLLETKNLEIKKINDEKKSALAAQFAAEGTLRRVHANQKDDEMPPIEAIITPLEAELKLTRFEVAKLQEDNRAMDRLTKSKEAALLEAERTIQMALAKAAMVDDLQNKNQDLMKQIEICQEENRILDKMHRQKVAEVEDLTQTVRELEEAVLAGGAAANAVRDYQRKFQEMNEERRVLDRELARAKVSANRVATVVANEWKDSNDKVMPVKQWLDERRFFQGEMQQLRDKLAVAERTAKAEAQLKEKYLLRFKVLEEKLKPTPKSVSCAPTTERRSISNGRVRAPTTEQRSISNGRARRQSIGGVELSRQSSNSSLLKRSNSQSGSRTQATFDGGNNSPAAKAPEKDEDELASLGNQLRSSERGYSHESNGKDNRTKADHEDFVSGMLYDMLQKEVITLRKASHEKDQSLKDKDDAIEMLAKKVDTLNKAMEVEAKKMKREMNAMGKEITSMRITNKEQDSRGLRNGAIRGQQNGSQSHLRRNT